MCVISVSLMLASPCSTCPCPFPGVAASELEADQSLDVFEASVPAPTFQVV